MLESYLSSVGYPSVDTAIRSLSFDADTLRAYLQNPNIVTLKFMVAHQPDYINGGHGGVPYNTPQNLDSCLRWKTTLNSAIHEQESKAQFQRGIQS
jgi:hypothetical protein